MMTRIGRTIDGAFRAFSSACGFATGVLLVACAMSVSEKRERIKELEKENKELKELRAFEQ